MFVSFLFTVHFDLTACRIHYMMHYTDSLEFPIQPHSIDCLVFEGSPCLNSTQHTSLMWDPCLFTCWFILLSTLPLLSIKYQYLRNERWACWFRAARECLFFCGGGWHTAGPEFTLNRKGPATVPHVYLQVWVPGMIMGLTLVLKVTEADTLLNQPLIRCRPNWLWRH